LKRLVFLLLFICCSFSLFASSGLLSGGKNLRVSKTQWFDLIYPERCEKTAAILYEKADLIYEEVTAQYGLTPSARIPVFITPAVESLNAFWSIVPYSHIVLYDTSFDSLNELAVFSESLTSIFRHELTHAVTFTMKNGFWNTVTKIFGDPVNPGPLMVSTGMSEGATLTSESAGGEGRLNSEYAKHYVKQAKIENKFPSYFGAQGAGSLNPYYFHSAFHEWLQNKYGMDAYVKFWYYTINVQGLTVRWRFKKAFGVKLDSAWKQFIQDYKIPEDIETPVEVEMVSDLNNGGAAFTSLTASNKKLYWLDSSSKGIYVSSQSKYKKLFTQSGAYKINVSADDRFMAVSYYSDSSACIHSQVKVYDISRRNSYTIKEHGLKDASIVKDGEDYYVVTSKFLTPENSIQVFRINLTEKGNISSIEKKSEKVLPVNVFTADYVSLDNSGTSGFACIKKDKLNYSISIFNLDCSVASEYETPDNLILGSLSSNQGELYFSWTKKGAMPRVGKFNLPEESFSLSSQDISGGVFLPVAADDSVVYVGKYLYYNKILTLNPQWEVSVKAENKLAVEQKEDQDLESAVESDLQIPESLKFNYFNYIFRGAWFPISIYENDYFGPNLGLASNYDKFVGATYLMASPWSDGTNNRYLLTAGWNCGTNFGIQFTETGGTDTSLFKHEIKLKTEFDTIGWKFSSGSLTLSSGFHFGEVSAFLVKNILEAKYGHQEENKALGIKTLSNDLYYNFYDNLVLTYSNVHYSGPGDYEKAGVSVSSGAYYLVDGSENNTLQKIEEFDLYGNISASIPKLLPLENRYSFTYNLPSIIDLKILPPSGRSLVVLGLNAETILFGYKIDRPLPLLNGVYLQNFKISFGYSSTFAPNMGNIYKGTQFIHLFDYLNQITQGDFIYSDSVYMQADLNISPNMGILARNEFQADFFVKAEFKIRNNSKTNPFAFNAGINLSY